MSLNDSLVNGYVQANASTVVKNCAPPPLSHGMIVGRSTIIINKAGITKEDNWQQVDKFCRRWLAFRKGSQNGL